MYGWRPRKKQGRSKDVRIRVSEENRAYFRNFRRTMEYVNLNCTNCFSEQGLVESRDGSLYCDDCGKVSTMEKHVDAPVFYRYNKIQSKPYERRIHFHTKLHRLIGQGADIVTYEDARLIENYLLQNPKVMGVNFNWVGPRAVKRACWALGFHRDAAVNKTRYPDFWIQIRRILNMIPVCGRLPEETVERLKIRYIYVSEAFENAVKYCDSFFKKKTKNTREKKSRNIMTVNYILLQLIRLESEELFRENAKFLPVVKSAESPEVNNRRWQLTCEYCSRYHSRHWVKEKDEFMDFRWDYMPLTDEDILRFVIYFR